MASVIYNAETYANLNIVQRSSVFQHIAKNYDFLASLKYPVRILDVGCGTGENTKLFTYFINVAEIVAFDVGPDMIEYAKVNNGDARIKYFVADVQNFATWPEQRKSYYDFSVSFFVLHWVNDNETALKNIFQSLRNGGYFMARILGRRIQCDIDLYNFIKESPKWNKYTQQKHQMLDHWWMNDEDPARAYGSLLSKVGFTEISYRNTEVNSSQFGTRAILKDYIAGSRLRHFNVPKEKYEEFSEECVDAFMKSCSIEEHGIVRMPPAFLVDILAQKI